MRLTDISIRALKPTDRQKTYFDDQLPGFGIRVSKRTKAFVVMYGKQRRLKTLGRYPDMSLKLAKSHAKRFLSKTRPDTLLRYENALESFLEASEEKNRPSTTKSYKHYLSKLETNKYVSDIEKKDLERCLTDLKPSGRSHAITAFRVFFNWCMRNEYTDKNPTIALTKPTVASRERVLSMDELKAIYEYDFPPLDYLDPNHEKMDAVGFNKELAALLGIGYAPKGVLRGKLAIPLRDQEGKLYGYLGVTEAYVPNALKA